MQQTILLTLEYPPQKGGIATYLSQEIAFEPSVKVAQAQDYFWELWPHWLPLIWKAKPAKDDFVWVSHMLPIGYVALVWKKLFGIEYRVYVHGLDLVLPKKSSWKRFWVKTILSEAKEIVANSNATAQLLTVYDIDQKRAIVRHPKIAPLNPADYTKAGNVLRAAHELINRPVLLTVSRLVKRKGIEYVLRALPDVWKQFPDLAYVIVGEGEDRERLQTVIFEIMQTMVGKTCGDIIFTGEVLEDEKNAWFSACNCFILTPTNDPNDFEGYGIVYKEAQQFGKSVIGSRVGGVVEAVGEVGVLVEAGDVEGIAEAIVYQLR